MHNGTGAEASVPTNGETADQLAVDPELEALREILGSHHRRRIAELQAELDAIEHRINDRDALVATITPVLADSMRTMIRDSRQDIIDALYPIIGQLIARAVTEAMRDLARSIDARMRRSFNVAALLRRMRARLRGISDAEIALRDALPFSVVELFLIHRESGLLIRHLSRSGEAAADSDLISGMLTAIRDFARDAFGRGQEGQLDEITYGDRRIIIEAAEHAYLAAVVQGVEPAGFHATLREHIFAINQKYAAQLRRYDGNADALADVDHVLNKLFLDQPRDLTP